MRIPVTSQDVVEQEKEKQEHGRSTCQFLGNESVNGDSVMLFSVHREYEEVNEDGKMWVSKSTGLVLHVEEAPILLANCRCQPYQDRDRALVPRADQSPRNGHVLRYKSCGADSVR